MSGIVVLLLRLLLVVALYAFLGVALWVLWKQLEQTSARIARRQIPSIRLQVTGGRQAPVALAFAQSEVSVGRDPLSDVPLQDEAVSVRHALLSFHHGQWWLQDLGSKNGTRLNSQHVDGATVLTNGDEIQCGQVRLSVGLDGGASNDVAPSEGG
jgi:pSer/pThr/pTyr-binding forkhead associated (FHA) protein